ncbi:MAG: polysaccharide biosynthesis protein [Candidatus Staskawiczbacteria bacterium RIFCSPLOWO2_01_FULL_37_25b]|uniref:Polysaccharide biosynthesis protein n=2 Tax=Candidatus Staskawicziibacteriota TaxID=1817916 RepID=A0A1G2HM33_9BACT|nr:MAG: polysaccharide biosynthesis protein [Candidatus Staskawiczbacteria bacterium RIFCSPHIGHO2_01_FULL_36_16]OGZ74236.1 MAG: polysaccharide biosynthesis protein [Candidatus Staskawiczbacteria bacterium RIFCSPLOWO2_01_FULL_37_25b]
MIPLSKADITDAEIKEVLEVLKSKRLALGPKLERFEKETAKFAGVKYAVAVNSGTSALHLIIRALGIGKSDGVITTPFSFISSSNCILYERANPVYVDIDKKTFNIDVSKIEQVITKKTKAILAVDIFSHPADWDELKKIAKKHALFLIEDSAEALGSEYKGKKCGSFGDAAIFAFYPNKQLTTGEGGIILTDNEKIANFCRSSANQGRKVENGAWLDHVMLGYNYRLDEMSCALGLAQIKRADEIIKKRRRAAELYNKKLKNIKELEIPYVGKNSKISWFVYPVKLAKKFAGRKRDIIINKMGKRGISCRDYFQPIHLQPFYRDQFGYKEGDFPITEDTAKRTLALPFFSDLSEKEIDFVVKNLKEAVETI